MNTKKARNGNSRYLRCKLEDFTGAAESVMWPDDYVRCKVEVAEDAIVIVKATVERTREEPGLVIQRVLSLEQAAREMCKELWLRLQIGRHRPSVIDALGAVLKKTPGPCPVKVEVRDRAGRRCLVRLSRELSINPATFSQDELEGLLGEGSVKLT
jgi:DNA polymerase III alpha subunit